MVNKIESIVNEVIDEVFGANQNVMDFMGLAMMIGRMYNQRMREDSPEMQAHETMYRNLYEKGGDEAVMKTFEEQSGIPIKPVGGGKYQFDYSDIDRKQTGSQTQWNYKYAGD